VADHILNAIIGLENEIEQQLQQEQRKADAWLDAVRQELVRDAETFRQDLQQQTAQLLERAAEQTKQKTGERVDIEIAYCHRLEDLTDQQLLEVVRRQLTRILPGHVDDHQNGQNRDRRS